MSSPTQVERIAALEVRVKNLEEKVDSMNDKLDQLLELKNKGAGAFWLASALMGTSIIGTFYMIYNMIVGK